jgi:ethanolamine utilization cobalamin adenosyltransferase
MNVGETILKLYNWINGEAITNIANGRKAVLTETQLIESHFSEEYTTAQTDTAIITPSAGNRLIITDVAIHTNATTGVVELDLDGAKVARLYSSVNNRFAPQVKSGTGAVDQPLTLTTTTGTNKVFVSVNYIEIEG